MKPLYDKIEELDKKKGVGLYAGEDMVRRESLKFEVATRLQMEEIAWKQKSRTRWVKKGDRNMKFFSLYG